MTRAAVRGLFLAGFAPVRAAIRGLALTGAQTGKAAVRGLEVTGTAGSAKAAVRGLDLTGTVGPSRAAVRGLTLTGGSSLSANAGGGRQADPFEVVTLDGRGSIGATSWSWAQVSGPTVDIVGSGSVVGFQAPALTTTSDIVIRLTVTDGTNTQTDDASITVYPHIFWRRNASNTAWVPERIFNQPFA